MSNLSILRSGRHRSAVQLLAVVALMSAVGVACVPPSAPPHQIDVNNPPMGEIGGFGTSNQWTFVQTFTAGTTGVLDQVHLWIQFTGPDPLIVNIRDVSGSSSLGAVVGSGTHTGAVPGNPFGTEVAVPLSSPAHVVAGHRYAVALRQTGDPVISAWQLSFSDSDQLPGESFFAAYDDGTIVSPGPTKRMSLRTWVRPS